jgi:hypothetical protein
MNPKVVFAGVYLLVIGGIVALVGALAVEPSHSETQWGLVIGGFAFQAVGVLTAIFGTWYETLMS